MQLEFHQLDLRYRELRVVDRERDARLLASLAGVGQKTPVLVVCSADDRYVLIDGYRRVDALHRLKADTVEALLLPITEPEGLILSHRMASSHRKSALEEGWLLRELERCHGLSRSELASKLLRSSSWVSRRLGLVEILPSSVQQAVRAGKIGPHAAMKSLLPLARANKEACETLVKNLGAAGAAVRQMDELWRAWRKGSEEDRERIVSHPGLYLAALSEVGKSDSPEPVVAAESVRKDLASAGGICRRVRRKILSAYEGGGTPAWPGAVGLAWENAQSAFASLASVMTERLP
jgi:ParB family transcriptional regulator, chromosome partitioning protein